MKEKKVEYIELIYDLIFVYLVGRSNALLHGFDGGFFGFGAYMTYIISTLVILQIWFFSTLFINRYGRNGVADHIGIFVNMYLLYYMADGLRVDWDGYYTRYNVAWGLVLVCLAAQYYIKLRQSRGMMPWEDRHLRYHMRLLLVQAAVVFVSIPVYNAAGVPLSWLSLLVGFGAAAFTERVDAMMPVNFEHLTERVMLYVVFTFGETIVGLADYFEGGFGLSTVYFSLIALLIVAGLFLSYGVLYNHIIDRERHTTGSMYMLVHIFLVIALNDITVALEFMREPEVEAVAKNIFLVVSILVFYAVLFVIGTLWARERLAGGGYVVKTAALSVAFAALMGLSYRNEWISIAVSAAYIYAMFALLAHRWKGLCAARGE